jgi:hypothetical protein
MNEEIPDDEFIEEVKVFYSELLLNQKPLGSEFEKILNDNLWDLYNS